MFSLNRIFSACLHNSVVKNIALIVIGIYPALSLVVLPCDTAMNWPRCVPCGQKHRANSNRLLTSLPIPSAFLRALCGKKHHLYSNRDRFRLRPSNYDAAGKSGWIPGHCALLSPPSRSSPLKGEEEFGSGLYYAGMTLVEVSPGLDFLRLPPCLNVSVVKKHCLLLVTGLYPAYQFPLCPLRLCGGKHRFYCNRPFPSLPVSSAFLRVLCG